MTPPLARGIAGRRPYTVSLEGPPVTRELFVAGSVLLVRIHGNCRFAGGMSSWGGEFTLCWLLTTPHVPRASLDPEGEGSPCRRRCRTSSVCSGGSPNSAPA